jgi:hypothetical protein
VLADFGLLVHLPTPRRASVEPHRAAIRRLTADLVLSSPRLRSDGTVVVHSDEAGYGAVSRLSVAASEIAGECVHVMTDDVPGALDAREM